MKNIFFILSIFLSLASCKEDYYEKTEYVDLNLTIKDSVKVAEINYSLNGSELIDDLEKQVNYDFCNEQNFIGRLKFDKTEIIFPAFASKNCYWPNRFSNMIYILIDKNSVIIPEAYFRTENNIDREILELLKNEDIDSVDNKSLDFIVEWKENTDNEIVKKRMFEILSSIKEYYNSISIKKFNKEISQLNKTEKFEIVKEFKIRIGFLDKKEQLPVPENN